MNVTIDYTNSIPIICFSLPTADFITTEDDDIPRARKRPIVRKGKLDDEPTGVKKSKKPKKTKVEETVKKPEVNKPATRAEAKRKTK